MALMETSDRPYANDPGTFPPGAGPVGEPQSPHEAPSPYDDLVFSARRPTPYDNLIFPSVPPTPPVLTALPFPHWAFAGPAPPDVLATSPGGAITAPHPHCLDPAPLITPIPLFVPLFTPHHPSPPRPPILYPPR